MARLEVRKEDQKITALILKWNNSRSKSQALLELRQNFLTSFPFLFPQKAKITVKNNCVAFKNIVCKKTHTLREIAVLIPENINTKEVAKFLKNKKQLFLSATDEQLKIELMSK